MGHTIKGEKKLWLQLMTAGSVPNTVRKFSTVVTLDNRKWKAKYYGTE